jgi:uncharacterized protein (TIGR03643 family)
LITRDKKLPGEKLRILLRPEDISRIIEMAWEDRTPFEAIKSSFGLSEPDVKALMKTHLKKTAYVLWRKRVNGRTTKHLKLRDPSVTRAYSPDHFKLKSK